MKRAIFVLLALALLGLTACDDTTAAWAFDSSGRRRVGDYEMYFNKSGNFVFVSGFAWNGETEMTLTPPDEVEGAEVFGVGNYVGSGATVNAGPINEAYERLYTTDEADLDEYYPGGWRLERVKITLRLGPKVTRVILSSEWLAREGEDGSAVVYEPRYVIECDPGNTTLTARNGHLYRRSNGEEVNIMALYWADEEEALS